MSILDIAFKDLLQVLRDKRSLLFIVAMPLIFTFVMGFAYRGMVQTPDLRLALGLVDQDPEGQLSAALGSELEQAEGLRLERIDLPDAQEAVRSGNLSAVLVIPADYSAKTLAGESVQLLLVVDPFSNQGQSALELVRPVVMHLSSSVQIAELSLQQLEALAPLADEAARRSEKSAAFQAAALAWTQAQDAARVQVEKVTGAQPSGASTPFGGNPYNQSSPGILVMFTLFGLITSATLLVQERKSRTLQRMMTTALHTWEIIAGHLLAMFLLVMLQSLLLIVFGQLVLGVDYMRQPFAILLVMTSLAAWAAALGLLIGTIAKGDEQVILIAMISMFLLSALGGAWFPLEGAGRTFAAVGALTPTAWAMTGFQNLLVRGLSFDAALLPSAVQLAYALLFFAVAVWQFRKQVA